MALASPVNLSHRAQLGDEVATYIRDLILTGKVRGGEFLRLERIATDLGVSATPVREALSSLRGEGFVQLIPRRGFLVVALSPSDLRDMYFVQAAVAGELAARAAARVTAADLAKMESLQEQLLTYDRNNDGDAVESSNHDLHRTINLAADSPKLAWYLSTASRYAPRHFFASIEGWSQASALDHRAILDALHAGDSEAARTAMSNHINHGGELLVAHLNLQGPPGGPGEASP